HFLLGQLGLVEVPDLGDRGLLLVGEPALHDPGISVALAQPLHRELERRLQGFVIRHDQCPAPPLTILSSMSAPAMLCGPAAWNLTVTRSLPRVRPAGIWYSRSSSSVGWYSRFSVAIFSPSTRMSNARRRPSLPRYVHTSVTGRFASTFS